MDKKFVGGLGGRPIQSRGPVHQKVGLNVHDSSGRTPLILASIEGQATTVAQLLKRNADARARDNSGKNAVHCAAARNSTWIVRNLLHNAPSSQRTNSEDGQGRTALGVASEGSNRIMVALLTLCDANIKTEDRPLDGAARGRLERPRGHSPTAARQRHARQGCILH